MPELFRFYGFVFFFFSREHEPPHVHVWGKGGDAKFSWNGTSFALEEEHEIKASDMKKIKKVIEENSDIILARWNEKFNML